MAMLVTHDPKADIRRIAPLATSSQRATRQLFYKMSGTRLSGRALASRRGTGDETWLARAAARFLRGEKHSPKERLHDHSQQAHRANASGPNAHAVDKALYQTNDAG